MTVPLDQAEAPSPGELRLVEDLDQLARELGCREVEGVG